MATGLTHTVVLREGKTECLGGNEYGQCTVPPLPQGRRYVNVAAGYRHSVLLRDDGAVVAFGDDADGQCSLPELPAGLRYVSVKAGACWTRLRRDDGEEIFAGRKEPSRLPGEAADALAKAKRPKSASSRPSSGRSAPKRPTSAPPRPFNSYVGDLSGRNAEKILGQKSYFGGERWRAVPGCPRALDWDRPQGSRAGRAGSRRDRTRSLPRVQIVAPGREATLSAAELREVRFDGRCFDFSRLNDGLYSSQRKCFRGLPPESHGFGCRAARRA